MKKLKHFLKPFLLFFVLTSCFEYETNHNHSIYKSEILRYVNSVNDNKSDKNKIETEAIIATINFSKIQHKQLKFGQEILIADLLNEEIYSNGGVKKLIFYLVNEEIYKSQFILLEPETSSVKINDLIIQFIKSEVHRYSGKYEVRNLYDNLLFYSEFHEGKLIESGTIRVKDDSKNSTERINDCTDWYLITRYFENGALIWQSEQYIGTTCSCEENTTRTNGIHCAGGGGGGGSNGLPQNPTPGEQYHLNSPAGVFKVLEYHCYDYGCLWEVVYTQLEEVVVQGDRNTYYFLPLYPLPNQSVLGPDGLTYVYDAGMAQWTGEETLAFISPDRPISNMTDYLKCFNTAQGAQITIYVSQPIANSSATHDGGVVGHTFVSISQNGYVSVFGFYPSTDNVYPIVNPSDPSAMGNDSGTSYDVSISTTVSASVLQQIVNYSISYPATYDLNTYNCSDFGIAVGNLAGLNLPQANGTWPGGGGSNPGVLGQYIRSMTTSGTTTKNTAGGTSPNNAQNCN